MNSYAAPRRSATLWTQMAVPTFAGSAASIPTLRSGYANTPSAVSSRTCARESDRRDQRCSPSGLGRHPVLQRRSMDRGDDCLGQGPDLAADRDRLRRRRVHGRRRGTARAASRRRHDDREAGESRTDCRAQRRARPCARRVHPVPRRRRPSEPGEDHRGKWPGCWTIPGRSARPRGPASGNVRTRRSSCRSPAGATQTRSGGWRSPGTTAAACSSRRAGSLLARCSTAQVPGTRRSRCTTTGSTSRACSSRPLASCTWIRRGPTTGRGYRAACPDAVTRPVSVRTTGRWSSCNSTLRPIWAMPSSPGGSRSCGSASRVAHHPTRPSLAEDAMARARRLHPARLPMEGGWRFRALAAVAGWRVARRAQRWAGRA